MNPYISYKARSYVLVYSGQFTRKWIYHSWNSSPNFVEFPLSFVLSGISRGKFKKNEKFQKYALNFPVWFFSRS